LARKRTKKPAKDVYLAQVPEMPNLYYISNLARAWEEWWRVLLAFRGGDYGVIIAGKDQRAGDRATEDDWHYVTRDTDPELWVCWQRWFIETELEDPHVYTNLNTLSRDLLYLSELPISIRFQPMFWVRSEEGWRVPLDRLLARGIRLYTAAEVEEERQRWEERRRWLEENYGPWKDDSDGSEPG